MKESALELYLTLEVERAGGKSYKWVSPGVTGVPDRILIFPGDKVIFAEIKTKNGVMSSRQIKVKSELEDMGYLYFVVRNEEEVKELLTWR